MGERGIPQSVEEFIRSTIVSVQQLELLLLLAADEAREWRADEASAALKSNPEATGTWLESLAAAQLVAESGGAYRYAPAPDLRPVVQELAHAYRGYRTRVTRLIFSRPDDPISGFAGAFRLRRKEP